MARDQSKTSRMRGGIQKRGKNSWQLRLYIGVDVAGRKQFHVETIRVPVPRRRSELRKSALACKKEITFRHHISHLPSTSKRGSRPMPKPTSQPARSRVTRPL